MKMTIPELALVVQGYEAMTQPDRRYARLFERQTGPAWIRRDCEGRFRVLAPDARAASLMIRFSEGPDYKDA